MGNKREVVVIGAGASGIAAATRLYERGMESVLVLEAEDRIGGRIHSITVGEETLEMGAQWIHGETGNVAYEIASKKNPELLAHSDHPSSGQMFFDSGGCAISPDLTAKLMRAFDDIRHEDAEPREPSTGEYLGPRLREAFVKISPSRGYAEMFLEWCHQFINSVDCCDNWFESSSTTFVEYEICDGDPMISWKRGGYKNIVEMLMEKSRYLSRGKFERDNILLGKEVKGVKWCGDRFNVRCGDGTVYEADQVAVTVSLGVLKENQSVWFQPPLPLEKIKAIDGLSFGTVNKIYFGFSERWWEDSCKGFNFLWKEEDKKKYIDGDLGWLTDVYAFWRVEHTEATLCAWIAGKSAREMEKCSEDVVKMECMKLLRHFLSGVRGHIPDPIFFARSNWNSNEHFRGSYSFRSVTTDKTGVASSQLAQPIHFAHGKNTIHFAGEASSSHFYSTVHGAIQRGFQVADSIGKYRKNND